MTEAEQALADAQAKVQAEADAAAKERAARPFGYQDANTGWYVSKPAEPRSPDNPHLELSGDAKGGWIGQVHTQDEAHVFTCMADDLEAAKTEIMRLHVEAVAKKEPDGASGAA